MAICGSLPVPVIFKTERRSRFGQSVEQWNLQPQLAQQISGGGNIGMLGLNRDVIFLLGFSFTVPLSRNRFGPETVNPTAPPCASITSEAFWTGAISA